MTTPFVEMEIIISKTRPDHLTSYYPQKNVIVGVVWVIYLAKYVSYVHVNKEILTGIYQSRKDVFISALCSFYQNTKRTFRTQYSNKIYSHINNADQFV